jgi:coenzyme F420-reducing hydrogenase delta subunit
MTIRLSPEGVGHRALELPNMEHSPVTAVTVATATGTITQRRVTAFVCTHCARGAGDPRAPRSIAAVFPQGCVVEEIAVPCTGRLQPEHLLRAVEAGADLVCIAACAENNCHFLEGSKRVRRRVEYVQQLLDGIEVGGARVLLLHLPGSARQDMNAGAGRDGGQVTEEEWSRYTTAATGEVIERLGLLMHNPLHRPAGAEEEGPDTSAEESDENED